jgi:hypothetical protein
MSIEWLRERVPGFAELPEADRDEVTSFFWLWSFFEATDLARHAHVDAIRHLVRGWQESRKLDRQRFDESLEYFKRRYFQNGVSTRHWVHLDVQRHGAAVERLVRGVLTGENRNDVDIVAALLIVAYRLRNNLVHGPKWAYVLRDQLSNFRHANAILRNAIETDGRGIHRPAQA